MVHAGVQLSNASFLRWSSRVSHLGSLLLPEESLSSRDGDRQAATITSSVGPQQLSSSVRSTQSPFQPGEMYQGSGFKEGYLSCVWRAEGEDPSPTGNLPMLFRLMLPCLERCSKLGAALQKVTSLGGCMERGSWRRQRRDGDVQTAHLGLAGAAAQLCQRGLACTLLLLLLLDVCGARFSPAPVWSVATFRDDALSPEITIPASVLCLFQTLIVYQEEN